MPSQKIFASPQDVEAAFYEALENPDLEAMMAVWAEDEEVVCVHPGGPRLVGDNEIREAWRRVFSGGGKLRVRLSQQTAISSPFAMISTLLESIAKADNETQTRAGGRDQRLCARRVGLAHGGAPRFAGAARQCRRRAAHPALRPSADAAPYQAAPWLPGRHAQTIRPDDLMSLNADKSNELKKKLWQALKDGF